MTDVILMLVILGAINHQITHIITTGVILSEFRAWVKQHLGQKMGYLTTCHLCAGTWVGFAIALVTLNDIQIVSQSVPDFFLVSFAVALMGRVWNEGLALASSKVSEIRAREAQP
jgi:hypothetical protein